jgi:hypothetical protein
VSREEKLLAFDICYITLKQNTHFMGKCDAKNGKCRFLALGQERSTKKVYDFIPAPNGTKRLKKSGIKNKELYKNREFTS